MNPRAALCLGLAFALLVAAAGRARADVGPSRQVTLFGIVAVPGGTAVDPKLSKVAPQLRKLLPGHEFRLLGVKSRRLAVGETMRCDLGAGLNAEAGLLDAQDADAKVDLRIALDQDGAPLIVTDVATPPNQLFFCDKRLPDGSRLVIGVGAR